MRLRVCLRACVHVRACVPDGFCSTGTVLRAKYPPFIYPQTGNFACPICGEQTTIGMKSTHDITSAIHIAVLKTMRDAQLAAPKPPIVFMSLEEFQQ